MRESVRLFLRGLLLQASFNPAGRQRGAFVWCLGSRTGLPLDEPFNTNPTLAGYVTGLALSADREEFQRRRSPLASALGALGDRLVWGLLRPLAVICALAVSIAGAIPAAAMLLLVYNPPELWLRWRSARAGLRGMEAVARDLSAAGLPRLAPLLGRIALCALGCMAGIWSGGSILAGGIQAAIAGGLGTVGAALLLRRSGAGQGIVAAVGALVFAVVWLVAERILS